MKNLLTALVLSCTVAALTMLAKSDLAFKLLVTALSFAAMVLQVIGWATIKFVV